MDKLFKSWSSNNPPHPQFQCFFFGLVRSRMDEINQTLRSATKIRNHNVEILGDKG